MVVVNAVVLPVRVEFGIGVAQLVGMVVADRKERVEPLLLVGQVHPASGVPFVAHLAIVVVVGVVAVVAVVVAVDRDAHFPDVVVVAGLQAFFVVGAVSGFYAGTSFAQVGQFRLNVDDAGHGVSAIEGALRTSRYVNFANS